MKKQYGFTLVELTVGMAVTLIVLAATVLAFRDATNANQHVTMSEDVTDNLRAGLNLIEQDLIQAGSGIPTGGIPIPSFAASAACPNGTSNINRPVLTGTTTFPVCNLYLSAVEPGNGMGPLIASPDATSTTNSDIITMLYQDNTTTSGTYLVGMDAAPINGGTCNGTISSTGKTVQFDSACFDLSKLSANGTQINPGDLILFSNNNGNALQSVSSVSGQTLTFSSGDAFGLNGQATATGGTIVQTQNYNTNPVTGAKIFNLGTYPPTTATRIWMISYYLDNVADPNHVQLIRRVNFNAGQPVGETLESLQFTFNFNDGKTANQPAVPNGFSENLIRSVNIYLGARSTNKYSQNRKYIRENFQSQVTLRSMAYFNQFPEGQ